MGARAVRQGVNRWDHHRGFWRTRDEQKFRDGAAREEAIAPVHSTAPATIERRRHPVVTAPLFKCFRVIRLFLVDDHQGIEDIGFSTSQREAMDVYLTEEGRARLLDPDGKTVADNWRKVERR